MGETPDLLEIWLELVALTKATKTSNTKPKWGIVSLFFTRDRSTVGTD